MPFEFGWDLKVRLHALEQRAKLLGRRGALGRTLGEQSADECGELGRRILAPQHDGERVAVEDVGEHVDRGLPLERLRTGQHLYAQVFTADGSKVLAAANTLQADVGDGLKSKKNSEAAAKVGRMIAEKALAAGIEKIAFDRSGYRYHGRVKALAEAAREGGLKF